MATQWNDDEEAALQGLPHLAQLLYLRAIRRYMNYQTGIVNHVGLRLFRNILIVERPRGSNKRDDQALSDKQMRVALVQLEKQGLLERLNTKRYSKLQFFLPLASRVLLRNEEEGHEKGMRGRALEKDSKNALYKQETENTERGRAFEGHERKGIILDSGINKIDRYADADLGLGEAVRLLVDGMCSQAIIRNVEHRKRLQELIEMGATRADLLSALEKARQAKDGGQFSVFYLDPIVRQLIQKRKFPKENTHATRNGLYRQTGAGIIAQICGDALEDDEDEK